MPVPAASVSSVLPHIPTDIRLLTSLISQLIMLTQMGYPFSGMNDLFPRGNPAERRESSGHPVAQPSQA